MMSMNIVLPKQNPSRMIIVRQQFTRRNLTSSSFSSSSSTSTISMPSQPTKSWERGAKLIKNTKVENQYLEHMRDIHDPSLHLKTIEDELKGTIGKALGKQGDKILRYVTLMSEQRQIHNELIHQLLLNQQQQQLDEEAQKQRRPSSSLSTSDTNNNNTELISTLNECITKHNEYRSMAIQARWELTVHRQAVGFIVNNHKFVQDKFPIGEKLEELNDASSIVGGDVEEGGNTNNNNNKKPEQRQFGDQLDWWQRIGRWK